MSKDEKNQVLDLISKLSDEEVMRLATLLSKKLK